MHDAGTHVAPVAVISHELPSARHLPSSPQAETSSVHLYAQQIPFEAQLPLSHCAPDVQAAPSTAPVLVLHTPEMQVALPAQSVLAVQEVLHVGPPHL